MTAENTIQWMMDFYPDIYPTRKHCLNQLFCVIGNGYKWINGELVDADPDEFTKRYKFKKSVDKAVSRNEEHWYLMADWHKQLKEIDPDYRIPAQYQFEWYPVYPDYAYITNYPDNITDSWKAALNECRELLYLDGIVLIGGAT